MQAKEVKDFPKEQQGFFIKVREDCFQGPFSFLNEARSEARKLGQNMEIYHGILKYINDQIIDSSELFLVPRLKRIHE
jgi:hypothetical protein